MRAWIDGRVLDDATRPALSVLDHAVTVGDGVFEVVKVIDRQPFAITRHLRRMSRSAAGLGLPAPDQAVVRDAVTTLLGADPIAYGRVRITYTAGVSPLGSERGAGPPQLMVVATAAEPAPPTTAVMTVPWVRNDRGALTGLKTTSYAENVLALARARAQGATEALFENTRGQLCEGTGTNVFCVVGGVATTPPLSSGCLAGITRELVLEWTEVVERDITMDEFATVQEAFLTSTNRDVQAVDACDGRPLDGPGTVTKEIADVFARRMAEDPDP